MQLTGMGFLIKLFSSGKIPIKGPKILGRCLYFDQQSAKIIFFIWFCAIKTKSENQNSFFFLKKSSYTSNKIIC